MLTILFKSLQICLEPRNQVDKSDIPLVAKSASVINQIKTKCLPHLPITQQPHLQGDVIQVPSELIESPLKLLVLKSNEPVSEAEYTLEISFEK